MKLSLSVKITIKDFFPKNEKIHYNQLLCLFSNNDYSGTINLGDITNRNSLKHKIEIFNSNIIYNIHMLDVNNKF